jgi:hypothetical protein
MCQGARPRRHFAPPARLPQLAPPVRPRPGRPRARPAPRARRAPEPADPQLQRSLARRQAEQRVPELVIAEHAVLVAVRVPCAPRAQGRVSAPYAFRNWLLPQAPC